MLGVAKIQRAAFALAAGTMALLAPRLLCAQQIVAFDVTYTATNANDSHYDVQPPPGLPSNWVSPVDYSRGTVHIHQEVMTKPSTMETMVDICFDGDLEGYGCIGTDLYKDTGTHETVAPMTDMWQHNKVAWTKKRTLFQLVVKDKNNNNGGEPPEQYTPTRMRIVLTVVAPGGTYTPPPPSSGDGSDAGAIDAGAAPDDGGSAANDSGESNEDGRSGTEDAAGAVVAPGPDAAGTSPADAGTTPPSTTPPSAGGASHAQNDAGNDGGCSVGRAKRGSGGLAAVAWALGLAMLYQRERRSRSSGVGTRIGKTTRCLALPAPEERIPLGSRRYCARVPPLLRP